MLLIDTLRLLTFHVIC